MWERQLSGTIFTDGQDFCSDKIAVGQDCCSDKCNGGRSCCSEEHPCGEGEGDCDSNSTEEETTARREQLLRTARIAVLPSSMVEMEEMDAALKNLLVGKAKATVAAIPIVAAPSSVEQTTVVLCLGMGTIVALPSATKETAAAPLLFRSDQL